MPDTSVRDTPTGWDAEATTALREILTDPALPVASTLTSHPGVDGRRLAALREAHDYIIGRKLGAAAARSDRAAVTLIDHLSSVDPSLAGALRWHSAVAAVLAALPPSRARNAVVGDVHRGDLITWAPSIRSWTWDAGRAPDVEAPFGWADAELEVGEYPGLYDAIVLWESNSGVLVIVPTHRERVSWAPADPPDRPGAWVVRLARASVHADEVIPLESDPRDHEIWPAGGR